MERVGSSLDGADWGIDRLELIAADDRAIAGIAGPRFREIPFLDGEIFIVFTVRDGLIARMDDYRTRRDALNAVGLGTP
jgi:hypothetical protein